MQASESRKFAKGVPVRLPSAYARMGAMRQLLCGRPNSLEALVPGFVRIAFACSATNERSDGWLDTGSVPLPDRTSAVWPPQPAPSIALSLQGQTYVRSECGIATALCQNG